MKDSLISYAYEQKARLPADLTHKPENEEWPVHERMSSIASHRP